MCGIAGFVGQGDRDDLERMAAALIHRGPDALGIDFDETRRVFLAHRRLSIVDLEGGQQPMWDVDRRFCVVFNGEIYNCQDLRDELKAAGYQFHSSHSDTEVILVGYKAWGVSIIQRLNGMFAFALYDTEVNEMILARDRFGEKPFFYSHDQNGLKFASEATALFRHKGLNREIDRLSLKKLLAYGYVPAPRSLFKTVMKVRPGTFLTYNISRNEIHESTYWEMSLTPDGSLAVQSEEDLAIQLRELVLKAVERRLMADVPLGVFLSGGIDSSIVLAAMRRHLPDADINAFTIGFTEKSYDESEYARQVADHFGAITNLEILDFSNVNELLDEVLSRLDEPFCDPSILPTFCLSRLTRRKVTVALSGDGGDELFGGYDPFDAIGFAQWYERLVPAPLHKVIEGAVGYMPISNNNMSLDFKLRRALAGLNVPWSYRLPRWMAPLDCQEIEDVLHEAVDPEEVYSEAIELWHKTKGTPVEQFLSFFTRYYLSDDIFVKSDRASMMNSLEVRSVFLDNDLVDFCFNLPTHLKYHKGQRKILLKKAFEADLPVNILNRKKKGFGIPVTKWLRDISYDKLSLPEEMVQADIVKDWYDQHKGLKSDYRLGLWSILSLAQVMNE